MFDFLRPLLAQAATAGELAQLSDLELIRRFPLLLLAGGTMFLAGLVCDLWLFTRIWSRPPASRFRVGEKPWGFLEISIAIAVYLQGSLLMVFLASLLPLNETAAWWAAMAGTVGLYIVLLTGLAVYLRLRRLSWREAFGANPTAPLSGLVGYFAVLPPLAVAMALSLMACRVLQIEPTPQPIAELFATADSPALLLLITVLAVVAAPVFEEIFFRGFLYPVLKQKWGLWPALLVISLLFAVVHFHLPSTVPLFVLGIGLALAYELSGSLLASITMHSLFNAANLLMLFYVRTHA